MKIISGNGSMRHAIIEFDAAIDTSSKDVSVEVEVLEKIDVAVIAEDAAVNESTDFGESENTD